MALEVNVQIAGTEEILFSGFRFGLATQERPNPGKKHLGAEGLRDIVVCSKFKTTDYIGILALCGQHDNGGLTGPLIRTEPPADLESIKTGEHQVQNYKVQIFLGDQPECGLATL